MAAVPVEPVPVPEVPEPDVPVPLPDVPEPDPVPPVPLPAALPGKVTETLTVDVFPFAVVPEIVFVAAPPVALPPVAAPPVADPPFAEPPVPPAPPVADDVDVEAEVGDTGLFPASTIAGTVNIEATRIPKSVRFMAAPFFFVYFSKERESSLSLFPFPLREQHHKVTCCPKLHRPMRYRRRRRCRQ